MSSLDIEYYERRAEDEISLAQRADHQNAVQAHYQLACAYLDKIHPPREAPASTMSS